jgi:hypothetical protein
MTAFDVSNVVFPFNICNRVGSRQSTIIVVLLRYHRKRLWLLSATVALSDCVLVATDTSFEIYGIRFFVSSSQLSS